MATKKSAKAKVEKAKASTKTAKVEAEKPKAPTTPPKVINVGYQVVSISALQMNPRNKRIGDIEAIGESVEANGVYGAIVARKRDKLVLKGHHTIKGIVSKGGSKVPVIWVECDDATADRILVADNRTNDLARYDLEGMSAFLSEMALAGNLLGTGFSPSDVAAMTLKLAPPPEFVEFNANAATQHTCPKCGYEFNGGAAAKGSTKAKK